jgi:protein gp37
MDLAWAESLIEQCQATNVAIHVKQLGSVAAKEMGLKHSKAGDWDEWPEHLRIREYPVTAQRERI